MISLDETLAGWLQAASARNGAAAALYGPGQTCSYSQLDARAGGLARRLAAQGVAAGDTLAVISGSSWLTTLLLYATSQLDASLYPLDPKTPAARRDRLLEQAGVDYVIRHEADETGFDSDDACVEICAANKTASGRAREAGVAVIIATSGSSGEPKGVMLGNASLAASVAAANATLDLRSRDCWLNCLPLYHVGGLSIVFRASRAGAAMALHQGFDPERVWRDINRLPVTHLSLVPAMLAILLDEARCAPPQRLRTVLVGGAALSSGLERRALAAGWPLCVSYGMSETSSLVATRCPGSRGAGHRAGGHGVTLLPGVDCEIVDETGAPTRGLGRIRLRGRCLMSGYANPQKRLGDGVDGQGWFTTDDLGCLDESACIRIVGRADETLISGGEKVHPHEVEMLMLDCPGIDAACVIGVDDAVWGQKVCAIYAGSFSERQVERWCRDALKGPWRPRQFVRVERLPRLASGKVDRVSLQRQVT